MREGWVIKNDNGFSLLHIEKLFSLFLSLYDNTDVGIG
jgi:hypothetical protein